LPIGQRPVAVQLAGEVTSVQVILGQLLLLITLVYQTVSGSALFLLLCGLEIHTEFFWKRHPLFRLGAALPLPLATATRLSLSLVFLGGRAGGRLQLFSG
jgi:hypothetical protein